MRKTNLENTRTLTAYNEIKLETFEILEDLGKATANQVALRTNRRYEAASMSMLKYFRYGLLRRRRLEGEKTFVYSLSERGLERLDWLRGESF